MVVRACDQGQPIRCGEVSVQISVERNQFPPEWIGDPPFQQTVSENAKNGSGVYTVTAQDKDIKVLKTFH